MPHFFTKITYLVSRDVLKSTRLTVCAVLVLWFEGRGGLNDYPCAGTVMSDWLDRPEVRTIGRSSFILLLRNILQSTAS